MDGAINVVSTVRVLGTQGEDGLEVSPLSDLYIHRTENLSTTGF